MATNDETIVARLRPAERDAETAPAFRVPPRNTEAEQALLGAVLVNNRAYERVSEFLRAEHFADPLHGRIFESCARLIERGQIADGTTLKHVFDTDPEFAEVGGADYIARLARAAVTVINAGDYGRIVYDLHLRRRLIDLGEDVVNDAFDTTLPESAGEQIQSAEQKLYELATAGDFEGGFQPFHDAIASAIDMAQSAFQREGRLSGIATGFGKLDLLLGGLHTSDLLVLAGRPSMGKTALATNIAFHAAKSRLANAEDGAVVGFFSLEMSAEQLATRILAEESQIPSEKIRKGELAHDQFERLVMASQNLQRAPFYIDDTPALTISQLRTRARRLKRQHGLGLIVVDYLQLVAGGGGREQNRVMEISEITRGTQDARQGAGRSRSGSVAAFPRGRAARGQAAAALRPSRIGGDRAGCGRGDVHLPRGVLPGTDPAARGHTRARRMDRQDGPGPQPRRGDHRQAAPRSDRPRDAELRGRVHQVRQHRGRPRPRRAVLTHDHRRAGRGDPDR